MKTNSEYENDDLREEYDFSKLQVVKRGPGRKAPNSVSVELSPDVAEIFPDANAVNEALRFLIKVAKNSGQATNSLNDVSK
ncbi:MAG: hypothetical protein RBJ76_21225 [Stenomitos frigidus ULC029]